MNTNPERDIEWFILLEKLKHVIGKKPTMNAILFLIGIQELGKGLIKFSKEEKQDLMHIAICKLLSQSGFYELEGIDQDGWPHYKNISALPNIDLLHQEALLKDEIKMYFKDLIEERAVKTNEV